MPAFEVADARSGALDWALLQNGFVHMYWRVEILDNTVKWLKEAGYQVISLDAYWWDSAARFDSDIAVALRFPEYYGRNLNALNDCLFDVACYRYGADPTAMGTVLVFRRYDSFVAVDRPVAEGVLDIFARQARVGALLGHRMLLLLQSNDGDLRLPPVGACPMLWNPSEFLDSKRREK